MIFVEEPFKSAWQGKDVFQQVQAISRDSAPEKIYRDKEGRRTLQFEFAGRSYFLKHHQGIGWQEIVKNLLQLRLPVLGARNEYEAAIALTKRNIDTLKPVAFAERGNNPAQQQSFLITETLTNTISLEDYCRPWPQKRPGFKLKKQLISKVANSAKAMHGAGINHRDFYLCHFLLEQQAENKIKRGENFRCYLIDLHRCQQRPQVPRRWQVKDLGGLLYSSMDTGLSARDYFRFIKIYSGKSLREALGDSLWPAALASAQKLYQKDFGKAAPTIFKGASA